MLSTSLQAALVGECEMTQVLMAEWHHKRPAEYLAHKRRSIRAAMHNIGNSAETAILV